LSTALVAFLVIFLRSSARWP